MSLPSPHYTLPLKIVLSLTLESVDGSNFFDEDKIIDNLAALLGVPKNKIKIAKIVAEGDLMINLFLLNSSQF